MSEYWKSTPKYWCKFCSTYVRDTPNEKRNHEATGKHKGGVQRSLRTIHKEQEIQEREKSRAKAEVDRLNAVVDAGKTTSSKDSGIKLGQSVQTRVNNTPAATAQERKQQMKQLADMGIAIPQAFRADMAMAGEWQTTSVRKIGAEEDVKPDPVAMSVGNRKRRLEGDEEDEEATGTTMKRKGWGKDLREYADATTGVVGGVEDIEALLKAGLETTPKVEEQEKNVPLIKKESSGEIDTTSSTTAANLQDTAVASIKEEEAATAPVVFKKRKAKFSKT